MFAPKRMSGFIFQLVLGLGALSLTFGADADGIRTDMEDSLKSVFGPPAREKIMKMFGSDSNTSSSWPSGKAVKITLRKMDDAKATKHLMWKPDRENLHEVMLDRAGLVGIQDFEVYYEDEDGDKIQAEATEDGILEFLEHHKGHPRPKLQVEWRFPTNLEVNKDHPAKAWLIRSGDVDEGVEEETGSGKRSNFKLLALGAILSLLATLALAFLGMLVSRISLDAHTSPTFSLVRSHFRVEKIMSMAAAQPDASIVGSKTDTSSSWPPGKAVKIAFVDMDGAKATETFMWKPETERFSEVVTKATAAGMADFKVQEKVEKNGGKVTVNSDSVRNVLEHKGYKKDRWPVVVERFKFELRLSEPEAQALLNAAEREEGNGQEFHQTTHGNNTTTVFIAYHTICQDDKIHLIIGKHEASMEVSGTATALPSQNCILYNGTNFAAWPPASPHINEAGQDMSGAVVEIPSGWQLVYSTQKDFADIRREVIAAYGWHTHVLVTSGPDGKLQGWNTSHYGTAGDQYSLDSGHVEKKDESHFHFKNTSYRLLIQAKPAATHELFNDWELFVQLSARRKWSQMLGVPQTGSIQE
eukprot:Skav202261  [mRNA]  locus=scaffold1417:410635:415015:+ [translate_table: standard]